MADIIVPLPKTLDWRRELQKKYLDEYLDIIKKDIIREYHKSEHGLLLTITHHKK